jgi:NhaP-type Na+/H+ or K+/H+ antiporter
VGLDSSQLHDLGAGWWRWLTIDLLWAVSAGLLVGWFGGLGVARLVLYLRRRFHETLTADEMLTLGMIALVYGVALAMNTYAFLAVFAAAVAIRRDEYLRSGGRPEQEVLREVERKLENSRDSAAEQAQAEDEEEVSAIEDEKNLAPARLAHAQLRMTQSAERLIEVTLVLLVGALISFRTFSHPEVWWFVPLLLLVIRPAVVTLSTVWFRMYPAQRMLAAWFGIRGIGTIYYLAHALGLGVREHDPAEARLLVDLCVAVICVSVVVHGISATPLMKWYSHHRGPQSSEAEGGAGGAAA